MVAKWRARKATRLPAGEELGAILVRIVVEQRMVRMTGREDVLEHAVAGDRTPVPRVRTFVRNWRAQSNEVRTT